MRIGIIAGVLAGLLFAPKAGIETRADIVAGVCDLLESGGIAVCRNEREKTAGKVVLVAAVGVIAGITAGLLLAKKTAEKKSAARAEDAKE